MSSQAVLRSHVCINCNIKNYDRDQQLKIFLWPHLKKVLLSGISWISQCLKIGKMHLGIKVCQFTLNASYKATEIHQEVASVSENYTTQLIWSSQPLYSRIPPLNFPSP